MQNPSGRPLSSLSVAAAHGSASSRWHESLNALERRARPHAATIAVTLALLLILGHWLTGIEIAFTLLYLIPICLAAWWGGRSLGAAIALLSACGASGVDAASRVHDALSVYPLRILWNYGGSLAIFVFFAALVARLRVYVEKEAFEKRLTVEQLRQADRLGVMGKLAAGLAHELGTPLSVIMGHAELLDSDRVTGPMIGETAATILAQTEKMTTIIRGLLDFSRKAGALRNAIDLDTLARSAAALLLPMAKKHDVEIEANPASVKGLIVQGNATELEQVLVNLMVNGIQAMPNGGTLRIRACGPERVTQNPTDLGSSSPPSAGSIEITDEGVGIAPEQLPQIFDPFFTTKDVGTGTGLGLSVSYGIVSDHGGRIEVTSSPGAGSTFRVYLPLSEVALPHEPSSQDPKSGTHDSFL